MVLKFFTEDAYNRLYESVDRNYQNYLSDEDWLESFFNGDEFYESSQVEVGNFELLVSDYELSDAEKSQQDLANVRLLYDAMRKLSPIQASNKYMWSYLCHAIPKFRKYIQNRWLVNPRENTIRTRFFVTGTRNLIDENALSRLWWYGHLSYDESFSDPYRLTKTLLINQTIGSNTMDSMNRNHPDRIKGVLLAIEDFRDFMGTEKGMIPYFREASKSLNHFAAVTSLEFLEPEEIRMVFLGFLKKALEENRQSI